MTTEQQLPEGWKKTTLGEICEIFDSKRVPLNREQREQRINNKKTDELFPYYGATGEVGKIDDYIFDGEFVLLGEDAAPFFEPNKNVAYCVKGKFWVNNHAHILSSSVLENLYICHYLNQFNFSGYVSGTTRLKLSQGSMKKIPIIYPTSKETQQAIVNKIESLFDEIDEGIGRLKTAAQQIQQYRQSLLKNAFNGELTKEWRSKHADTLPSENELLAQIQTAREQHHAQQLADWQTAVSQWEQNGKEGKKPSKPKAPTKAVKFEENFADLPSGWIWGKLSDLGELARGKSKHRPRNDKKLFGGKYPFIQTGEVRAANRIIKKYEQTYSEFGLEQSKLWQKGTLCITIAANIAETAFLGFDACFPDSIVGFSASKAVLPEYIELFIKSARTKIESYAPATAQKNINLNTLENLIVPYCSLTEQTQIVAILESKLTACDQLAAELSKQLKQAELLKQAVLKAAFSGSILDK
ncbi:restriction endonuclease subunit S [Neisseria sp. P0022.S007]|uniref:restriction endonuclease subunit S n=1 Tax=unclassified Neisseria TaxID=2623750 RepID=UPI003F800D67